MEVVIERLIPKVSKYRLIKCLNGTFKIQHSVYNEHSFRNIYESRDEEKIKRIFEILAELPRYIEDMEEIK